MKTPKTESSTPPAASRRPAGQDATLEHMAKMNRPMTARTYVAMNWPGMTMQDLGAEELASIPEELQPNAAAQSGTLPAASTREQFDTTDEFDEAMGYWQSHAGRIKAMIDLANRSTTSPAASASTTKK